MRKKKEKKKNNKKIILLLVSIILVVAIFLLYNNRKVNKIDDPKLQTQTVLKYKTGNVMLGDVNATYDSEDINYNNGTSGMKSHNVQNAIDELYNSITNGCYVGYTKGTENGTIYTCNKQTGDAAGNYIFDSSEVIYDNSISDLDALVVEDAINELIQRISYCRSHYVKQNETSSSYECKNKSDSTLTLANSIVNLTYGDVVDDAYTYDGDGVVSCVTSDPTKLTCAVDDTNNVITLTAIGANSGVVSVTVSATEGSDYLPPQSKSIIVPGISQRTVNITAPTVNSSSLTYNASSQNLLSDAGSCSTGGTMYWYTTDYVTTTAPVFATENAGWTTLTPTPSETNAGTYYIWYYCYVSDIANNTGTGINTATSVTKEIAKRTVTVTAPAAASGTFTYNSNSQTIFSSAGSCTAGGTMYWYSTPTTSTATVTFSTSTWSTTAKARTATNAGTYRYYYYCRVTDTANNEGTNINTVKYASKAIGKADPTFSLSATTASVTCLTSKTITVTTNGDGTITCTTPSGNNKASCAMTAAKKATISGNESGSVTVSIKLNAGTNYNDAPVGKVSTTVTCYVWKAQYDSFQQCQNNCTTYVQCRENGWKCTDSKTSQPTSSSSNGKYCWCKQ